MANLIQARVLSFDIDYRKTNDQTFVTIQLATILDNYIYIIVESMHMCIGANIVIRIATLSKIASHL